MDSQFVDVTHFEFAGAGLSGRGGLDGWGAGGFISDPSILSIATSDMRSEPVLIAGLGLDYKLRRNWISTLRLNMRTTQNDRLDAHQGTATNINDYYTYLSIGMVYLISPANGSFEKDYPCSPW